MSNKKHGLQALEALLTDDADMTLDDLKRDVAASGIDVDVFTSSFRDRIRAMGESRGRSKSTEKLSQAKTAVGRDTVKALPADFFRAFPVKEMHKRQWFLGFSGTPADALANASTLVADFLKKVVASPKAALLKQRVRNGSHADKYALLAWKCRVLERAESVVLDSEFDPKLISNEWLSELIKLSAYKDGPKRVPSYLARIGIAFIVEPHLPSTHLDGAAMLGRRGPVVGMTLRYDRLDNFWFVLLHELIHVQRHLKCGAVEDIFDNLDVTGEGIELEADEVALSSLIPQNLWELSVARYVCSEAAVKTFASQLGISPAIVAGRIRNESKDWTLLSNLIGQGEVRAQFNAGPFLE